MIRLFSVLCKLNTIKFSDRKWFAAAAAAPLPPNQSCPCCSARGRMRPLGHYKRYLVEWDGAAQVSSLISVPRYICDSCGHSHAALPSCIIPYRSYSLRFLLVVLRAYFIRVCSVEQICIRYGITISMLYRWIRLFRKQKEIWLGVLESAAVQPAAFIDSTDGLLLKEFFFAFRFSYLESPHGISLSPPSQLHHRPGCFT